MATTETPVLIVGGGPVGLTASILLSHHGVRSLLVERHPRTTIHPKARGLNARTMEIYHQLGVAPAIRAAALAQDRARFIIWCRTLAGEELERRVPSRTSSDIQSLTPVRSCLCGQDVLEPVLRDFAERNGAGELRFDAELTALEQDARGVKATLVDCVTERETTVRASYVIAADGPRSRIRRALGVRMLGHLRVYEAVHVLIHADLQPWTKLRPSAVYFVDHPKIKAAFVTINGVDRWGFRVSNLTECGLTPDDFTPERTVELVRLAAGVQDLPVEVLGILPWNPSAHVAEQYRHGRIFLAGDAAHEMPPGGGFGLNTGVQDVHNLAWKLAGVLHGWAGPSLLDTYHEERQPVARTATEHALAALMTSGRPSQLPGIALTDYASEQGVIFGMEYESSAVVPDGTAPPAVRNPGVDYAPSARPGGRAPHEWLDQNGTHVSTIDLVGRRFVLFATHDDWRDAARRAAGRIPLEVMTIGRGGDLVDSHGAWRTRYGLEHGGAVLVRPDGYVAWRAPYAIRREKSALRRALRSVLAL